MSRNFIILSFLLTLYVRSISATPHSLSKRDGTAISPTVVINCGNNQYYSGVDAIKAANKAATRFYHWKTYHYPLDATAIFNGRYPGTRGPYKLFPLLSGEVFQNDVYHGTDFIVVDSLFKPIGAVTLDNSVYEGCLVGIPVDQHGPIYLRQAKTMKTNRFTI
ncbi:hypothetical protein K3495_g12637 [Podosphaera aphanis]|nr:hypothetical protein K3495_g12637 [Podosphaera aphanis]